jgi:hypothetical protein
VTGSLYFNVENLHIGPYPQPGQTGSFRRDVPVPKTAILLAQVPSYRSNAFHFDSILVTGKYSIASFYCFGVPSSTMVNCDYFNYLNDDGVVVVAFTRDNYAGVTSEYTKVYDDAYGGFAGTNTSDWTIMGCEIHEWSSFWTLGGRSKTTPLRLENTMQMRWIGGNISGEGPQHILLTGKTSWINFVGTTIYSDFTPAPPMVFNNQGEASSLTIQGCVLTTTDTVFGGSNDAVYNELNFHSRPAGSGAKSLFNSPGATLLNSNVQCDGLPLTLKKIETSLLINPGEITAEADSSTKVR